MLIFLSLNYNLSPFYLPFELFLVAPQPCTQVFLDTYFSTRSILSLNKNLGNPLEFLTFAIKFLFCFCALVIQKLSLIVPSFKLVPKFILNLLTEIVINFCLLLSICYLLGKSIVIIRILNWHDTLMKLFILSFKPLRLYFAVFYVMLIFTCADLVDRHC